MTETLLLEKAFSLTMSTSMFTDSILPLFTEDAEDPMMVRELLFASSAPDNPQVERLSNTY